MTLDQLARAYELRQSGLCWKLVARELGGDARLLAAQVAHLCTHGIRKGLDGYARQPGRAAGYSLDVLRRADRLRRKGYEWALIAPSLGAVAESLRKAWRYAHGKGLL